MREERIIFLSVVIDRDLEVLGIPKKYEELPWSAKD